MSTVGGVGDLVLPRRVHPQPTPELNPGGDCGACVLGGALGISIERVYDDLKGKRESISDGEMRRMLRVAVMHKLADRALEEAAQWPRRWWGCDAFGRPSHMEAVPWFAYVRMAIDAGYYGIAMVDTTGARGTQGGTNHWVMLCGARNRGHEAYDGTITGEVLVSDSRRSVGMVDKWIEAREFLQDHGGYDVMFVRPAT